MTIVRLTDFDFKNIHAVSRLLADFGHYHKIWRLKDLDFQIKEDKDVTTFLLKYGGRIVPTEEQTVQFVGSLFCK